MNKLSNAIDKTKKQAIENGEVNQYGNPSLQKGWNVENCAEVWSVRQAIMNGAKFDDLEYKCVFKKDGRYASPCENCLHTFSELKNSGQEDEWYVE